MRAIALIVLFLMSYNVTAAGNVHIYSNGKIIKAHIFVIKKCGKRVAFIFTRFGKTKVVLNNGISKKLYNQISNKMKKQPTRGKISFYPAILIPCESQQYSV